MGMTNNKGDAANFPNPFASPEEKESDAYGLSYARAIESQWGTSASSDSLYSKRMAEFENNRDYANGTQSTQKYKSILTSMNPNDGDGTLLNLDWSSVPLIPKFVKVVVNKTLSRKPYPAVEALDPISKGEKEVKKAKIESAIENRAEFSEAKALGLNLEIDPDSLPETSEEAEIFLDQNIKTSSEIAAQLATSLTLDWNDFDEKIYRRNVHDLVECGMAGVKRENDPNYGIRERYVDPSLALHSYTEDPGMNDIVYAGDVQRMSIMELKRLAGDTFSEKEYEEIARRVKNRSYNNSDNFGKRSGSYSGMKQTYGYDEYLIDVMCFEFLSVDSVYYESKDSQYGNTGFYHKGFSYNHPTDSKFTREPHVFQNETVYGGYFVPDYNRVFGYGRKNNIPKNIYDLTRARLSYSFICTNIRRMIPKSMVSGITGFADQCQLSHLKIQQSIAKAKPDGLIIDVEGLENVTLGDGGALKPLQLHDVYEQTGIYYYRSRNEAGERQAPPIGSIDNSIRNIQTLILTYNHYLNMMRDVTGINEAVDASTPKGEALVGVQQQAIAASNNALYDITNASTVLYRKVCEDIVKCLQIIPEDSVLYQVYEKAIGEQSMEILSSFKNLPMFNFGIRVVQHMSDDDKVYLEGNLQQALSRGEIDIEDAMAVRDLKDVDQAQRLLAVRRRKRMAMIRQEKQEDMQLQGQITNQSVQVASQARMEEAKLEAQIAQAAIQMKGEMEMQVAAALHPMRMEIEEMKLRGTLGFKEDDKEFKEKLEVAKEDRKDARIEKEAAAQSKLIKQRQTEGETIKEAPSDDEVDEILNEIV